MKYSRIAIGLLVVFLLAGMGKADRETRGMAEFPEKWHLKINSRDLGYFEVPVTFEMTDREKGAVIYSAYSRKHALGDVFGWFNALKFRLFTDYFKKGALLRIEQLQFDKDASFTGKLVSAFGTYRLEGVKQNRQLSFELKDGNGNLRGKGMGRQVQEFDQPEDLSAIAQSALDTIEANLYNPDLVKEGEWRDFRTNVLDKAGEAKGDVELLFAFFFEKRDLNISHVGLFKDNPHKELALPGSTAEIVNLEAFSEHTGMIELNSFAGSGDSIRKALSRAHQFDTLFVDLRSNAGGNVEGGLAFASRFIDTPMKGGYFLTRKWFEQHDTLPSKRTHFPVLDTGSYELLMDGIHRKQGLRLQISPSGKPYQGKVYLVTGPKTASTCEPIVYAFKKHDLATIVGRQTAGAMLNAEYFNLTDHYQVMLPTATYYTEDGVELEGNGVTPDIKLDPGQSLREVVRAVMGSEE